MILDLLKLLAYIYNVILRLDSSKSLIAGFTFYDCLKVSIELDEHRN